MLSPDQGGERREGFNRLCQSTLAKKACKRFCSARLPPGAVPTRESVWLNYLTSNNICSGR